MLNSLLQNIFTVEFFASSLRLAAPLILAVMGGIVSERTGVVNLSLEGFLLVGAFFGFLGSNLTGSPIIGLLFAMGAAVILGSLFAFSTVNLNLNQIVIAVVINMLAVGLTSTLFRTIFGTSTNQLTAPGFKPIFVPILSQIPIIGPIFFQQTIFVYIGLILLPITAWVINKTTIGLKIRASGEYPKAADTMGVPVSKVRFLSLMYSAAITGLGGASLSISGLNTFIDNMSAGRGFIAFSCIIFGKFRPAGAMFAAMLFGIFESTQLRIQAVGVPIPYQLPLMFPYILTLVMLIIMGASMAPQSWGVPYESDAE